jgi:CheY-like chemotaxis protein
MGLFQKKQPAQAAGAAERLAAQVETVRAVLRNYAPGTKLTFGAPTRCPECGDYGFVQGVNRSEGVSYNHCFGCQADWVISIEAMRIVHADPGAAGSAAGPPASTVAASPWFAQTMGEAVPEPQGPADVEPVAPIRAAAPRPATPRPAAPRPAAASEGPAPAPAATAALTTFEKLRGAGAGEPVTRTPVAPVAPVLATRKTNAPEPGSTARADHERGGDHDRGREPAAAVPAPGTLPTDVPAPGTLPTDVPPPGTLPTDVPVVAESPVHEPTVAEPTVTEPPVAEPPAPHPIVEEPAADAGPAPRAPSPVRAAPDAPVLDAAMLAQLSRPGRVVEPVRLPADAERVLRVLVAEDNPFDLAVLEELVDLARPRAVELLTAATREEAERLAASSYHDLVLLDLDLPDSTGITTLLEWQHRAVSSAPVIILSGSDDPAVIREARALGAVHFIKKAQLSELADAGTAGANRLSRLLRTTVTRASSEPRSF